MAVTTKSNSTGEKAAQRAVQNKGIGVGEKGISSSSTKVNCDVQETRLQSGEPPVEERRDRLVDKFMYLMEIKGAVGRVWDMQLILDSGLEKVDSSMRETRAEIRGLREDFYFLGVPEDNDGVSANEEVVATGGDGIGGCGKGWRDRACVGSGERGATKKFWREGEQLKFGDMRQA
ncbi:unnamed protein product [Linum trigynum]|uniref:Uncharacterized protein n=1 Tax=Linum trigynum TaxID=586398 RepID=A0AAV2E414_9ROSI